VVRAGVAFEDGGELLGTGECGLLVGGQTVVGVVGDCERRGCAGEGVADDGFVAAGDEEDADGWAWRSGLPRRSSTRAT